ncbi:MAG: aspartate/glutamate racemase family protein [Pseudomonadota bacterium]
MGQKIRMIFPVPLSDETRGLIESQVPESLVNSPDFEVEFVGSKRMMSLANSYYDLYIMEAICLEAGLKAQDDGCAAVCINTVSDSALYALRSRLSIPVIAPGQAAFHTACMLGHKFSILTMWAPWIPMYEKTLKEYGLTHRLASIRHINTRPDVEELLMGKEDIVFGKLEEQGLAAIEEDGAEVIVIGSTTMHQSHAYLAKKLPVPVINPGVLAYKLCEMLIALGLSHSKLAFPDPELLQDEALFP